MIDLDDGLVKFGPLGTREMGELHLPADVDSDGDVKQMEGKLLEVLVFGRVVTDLVQSKKIILSFLLVVQLHEVLANLSHSVLGILDGLDLDHCLLLDDYSRHFLLVLLILLLFGLHLLISFIIGRFSLWLQQPIFSTDHRVRRLQQFLIIFLFFLAALIIVVISFNL